MRTVRKAAGVAATAALLVALAGCSSGSGESDEPFVATDSPTPSPSTPTPSPSTPTP